MIVVSYLYYISFILASLCAVTRYKMLDIASTIFALYVWIGSFNEIVAGYSSSRYKTDMPVYAIYCLIEFALISIYFNYSIDFFKKNNIGYYMALLGVILGVVNIVFIQGMNILTTYFLIFEGIFIIGMGLFSFFRLLLKNDNLELNRYPHFWFTSILLFFWSFTFISWALYNYFYFKHDAFFNIISKSISVVGILFYASISCVFIFYPKMQKRYE